jgi:N-acetyltransferase 10
VVTRVNIFREHRQTVQYVLPTDHAMLAQAELVAIDEAAAIPLPVVQKLQGPYLVFMASTVNGYEGTGRALSLKLIHDLRQQQHKTVSAAASNASSAVAGSKGKKGQRKVHEERWRVAAEAAAASAAGEGSSGARSLTELTLTTPIRYGSGDEVEKWLNALLCLDATAGSTRMMSGLPAPRDCELYLVDRDALFSYHSMAEGLLQRIWALYTSAHYKNTPNDLQMLSDAPAHRLFVLLGPRRSQKPNELPDILCVVQVAFEGRISQQSIQAQMSRGNKASGDMIPWTVSQQFNDGEFASLSGARVVRIATHPGNNHRNQIVMSGVMKSFVFRRPSDGLWLTGSRLADCFLQRGAGRRQHGIRRVQQGGAGRPGGGGLRLQRSARRDHLSEKQASAPAHSTGRETRRNSGLAGGVFRHHPAAVQLLVPQELPYVLFAPVCE